MQQYQVAEGDWTGHASELEVYEQTGAKTAFHFAHARRLRWLWRQG